VSSSTFRIPHSASLRPPLIWRSAAVRLLLGAFPIWSATAVLTFHTGWALKLIVGALALLTLATPAAGLSALALMTPLALAFAGMLHLEGYRMAEMFVLTFLAAWLLRAGSDRSGPRVPPVMAAAGWLLALATATSVAVLAWRMHEASADLPSTVARLWGAYFLFTDPIGFGDGARLVEGLGLVAATMWIFRRSPSLAIVLPFALCTGAALAGAVSMLIREGIGPAILLQAFRKLGRAAHVFDVNAAASYFAMALFLAIGMTARLRGMARAAWIPLVVMDGVGLWFADSRSARAALVITTMLAAVWLVTRAWSVRTRASALVIVIAVAIAGAFIRNALLERDPTFHGAGFRQQFYSTSLRMIRARPLSGVGIGQYARMSPLFLTPQLAWSYGFENAHNYFLQIGGELGIPGFAFFTIWVVSAFAVMVRSLDRTGDARLLGAVCGVVAFLMTCVTGHPLLVSEVAFPFWIQFGLTLALAASPLLNASIAARVERESAMAPEPAASSSGRNAYARLLRPLTACAAGLVMAATVAGAVAGPVQPSASPAVDGFYGWETAEDGRRVRWTGRYGSLFVPADVKRVYVPIRVPVDRPTIVPMPVDIVIGGRRHGRVLAGTDWGTLDLPLPDAAPPARFKRIDLRVDRTWQPALYVAGSYDMRPVGIQVGECELVR
jgi:O-antigen ligase